MNSMFFWIIVCFWLIPMGIRMYNRSRMRRTRNDEFENNGYRNFPGGLPGNYNQGPYGQNPYPPGPAPMNPPPPGRYDPRPYDPSMYPPEPPAPQAAPPSSSAPAANSTQPHDAAPQGYRARKLAELDEQYSDGKIAMEDYMKLRQEIMNG